MSGFYKAVCGISECTQDKFEGEQLPHKIRSDTLIKGISIRAPWVRKGQRCPVSIDLHR